MKNASIDKILAELDKTKQFVQRFRDTGKMPDIERDIVLTKLRNMYEFIQLIQLEEVEVSVLKEKTIVVENIQEVIPPSIESEPVTVEFDDTPEKEDKIKEEEIVEVEKNEPAEPQPQPVQPQPKPSVKKEILAEKFQSQSFLNEALSQFQNVSDLSKKLQNQPLKDIFSAINLNDKFLFIKELFSNDTALYQSTVEKLNNAGNFNDAVRYLDGNFTWDFNDQMVQNFLELVRRRFM